MTSLSFSKENLKISEAALQLNVSTRHLYYLINKGEIIVRKFGKVTRIHKDDLNDYMENCRWLGEKSLADNPHLLKEKMQKQNFGTLDIGKQKKADGDTPQQEPRIIQMPSTT